MPPCINPFQVESLSHLPRSVFHEGNCRAKRDCFGNVENTNSGKTLNRAKVWKLSIVPRSDRSRTDREDHLGATPNADEKQLEASKAPQAKEDLGKIYGTQMKYGILCAYYSCDMEEGLYELRIDPVCRNGYAG